jgi:hypothetical protein
LLSECMTRITFVWRNGQLMRAPLRLGFVGRALTLLSRMRGFIT